MNRGPEQTRTEVPGSHEDILAPPRENLRLVSRKTLEVSNKEVLALSPPPLRKQQRAGAVCHQPSSG